MERDKTQKNAYSVLEQKEKKKTWQTNWDFNRNLSEKTFCVCVGSGSGRLGEEGDF